MTRLEFAAVLTYLTSAVGKPIPADQQEVYFDLLADLRADLVLRGVKRVLCESRYPTLPPVGAIRAAAAELCRDAGPSWPEAWKLACAAARRFGATRPTRLTAEAEALASLPAAAARAAAAIGWRAICDADEGALDTIRAQFRDVYGTLGEREGREKLLPGPLRADVARLAEGVGALPGPEQDLERKGKHHEF